MRNITLGLMVATTIALLIVGCDHQKDSVRPVPQDNGGSVSVSASKPVISKFDEIGREYKSQLFSFKINKVSEETCLTPDFGSPEVASEDTKFVVVSIKVTNVTNEEFPFFPDQAFRLQDSDGRRYQMSDRAWQSVKDYVPARDLGPGVPESGSIVYEVPKTATGFFLTVK